MPERIELPGGRSLDFSGPALVMAIVNCNEDSFYGPSRALGDSAAEMALAAEKDGASIVDFGAESSRPGSSYICCEEELERLIPAVRAFRRRSSLPISDDTRKAAVARSALDAGADIINDISALSDDGGMASLCAERGAAVALTHKKGIPLTMQNCPSYKNLIEELLSWCGSAVNRALDAGIPAEKIILDPGIGFGKSLEDNLEIIRKLPRLAEIGGKHYPLLIGLSRKNFIGEICGCGSPADERLAGTLAANAAAVLNGADIIRVHDVKEHADLAKVLAKLKSGA